MDTQREQRMAEYFDWIRRTGAGHDVGLHVGPDSWRAALTWALMEISELEQEVLAIQTRNKELEATLRWREENAGTNAVAGNQPGR